MQQMLTNNIWLDELETFHHREISMQERLDNPQDDMETVKQLLTLAATVAHSNSEAIKQLTDRLDRLTARTDQLVTSQENTQSLVSQLAVLMVQFTQNAEADRVIIRGIQAENQRILELLSNRQQSE
jgi:hypothetical protein